MKKQLVGGALALGIIAGGALTASPAQAAIVMCKNYYYGTCENFADDGTSNLQGTSWEDQISSLKLTGKARYAEVYRDRRHTGPTSTFTTAVADLRWFGMPGTSRNWDDEISSFR